MNYKKLIDGVYVDVDENQLINGDRIKKEVVAGVWAEMCYSAPVIVDKSDTERAWRDSELSRTDAFVILPDFPVNLLPYRLELRNYPLSADFPNGVRPTI